MFLGGPFFLYLTQGDCLIVVISIGFAKKQDEIVTESTVPNKKE